MFNDVTSLALRTALSGLSARQRATADNVANIQTPNFLATRVQFEDALRSAVGSGDASAVASVTPSNRRSLEPTREDGNNVNLDTETLADVDSGLRYQLMIRAVDDRFNLLRASARTS